MSGNNAEHPEIDWGELEQQIKDGQTDPMQALQGQVVTPEMLAKRLLWDVTPCGKDHRHPVEVARYLGMNPASDDVDDMEHSESHQRLNVGGMLAPFVAEMSQHAAAAIVGSMIVSAGDTEHISDAERDDATVKLQPLLAQASYAILAELLDFGVLHTPHFATFFMEEFDGE